MRTSKKERFFWQYNVQAKGPKGQRLVLKTRLEDPHCLNQITDPVFSPQCSVQGIKHRFVCFVTIYVFVDNFVYFKEKELIFMFTIVWVEVFVKRKGAMLFL